MAHSTNRLEEDESSLSEWWDKFEQRSESGSTQEVHVFVRSVSPRPGLHAHRKDLMDCIQNAAAHDWIDDYDITVLGDDICLCDACESMRAANNLIETVESLSEWRTGGMKACGFTERTVSNSITDESYKTISPPDITISVFSDEQLKGVFPCRVEGTVYSPDAFVSDLLAMFDAPPGENRTASQIRS